MVGVVTVSLPCPAGVVVENLEAALPPISPVVATKHTSYSIRNGKDRTLKVCYYSNKAYNIIISDRLNKVYTSKPSKIIFATPRPLICHYNGCSKRDIPPPPPYFTTE